jgi:hypothetical protein
MTTFDDRENAFENMFAHDAELHFRAEARAVKILAHWAAKMLGKSPEESAAYVPEVIAHDFRAQGHDAVLHKLVSDLGHAVGESTVRARFAEALREAKEQLHLN